MKTPIEILKEYWGYPSFRPMQEEIIQSVLQGKDTLGLLPTGGGKSICFQVPALCLEGVCIVVTPLIALMKDQVDQLQKRNIPAVAIYSGMPYSAIDRALDNCIYGNTRFLYLSPERLVTDLARTRISQMKVNLLAVDEAHCISQWGYDFRPSYLEITAIRELLPEVPVLALTATATKRVVEDIQDKLNFTKPNVFQKSFERTNLSYVVFKENYKEKKLLEILQKVNGSAIVYVRSRRNTREIAVYLTRHNISADFYHAGLPSEQRSLKQERWINNQTRVMVATNAFGMGIDKPDVRSVVHLDLPESLEAYFQEAGRAGRDEKKAYCVLLYDEQDIEKLERGFVQSFPSIKRIKQIYRALGSYFQLAVGSGKGKSFDFEMGEFARKFGFQALETFHCLRLLSQAGWIVLTEAVFLPATIKFKVSREVLYDYQLKYQRLDLIVKWILRLYPQTVNHHAPIKESKLAKNLNIDQAELYSALQKLVKDHIIEYHPQKDQPQLIFSEERVGADNLMIDKELYDFRKVRQRENLDAIIKYVSEARCRSRQLLAYFGEKDAPLCGVCDVCLGRTKTRYDEKEYDRYRNKIQRLVKRDRLPLDEVINAFGPKRIHLIEQVMEYLLEEEIVEIVADVVVWKQ